MTNKTFRKALMLLAILFKNIYKGVSQVIGCIVNSPRDRKRMKTKLEKRRKYRTNGMWIPTFRTTLEQENS